LINQSIDELTAITDSVEEPIIEDNNKIEEPIIDPTIELNTRISELEEQLVNLNKQVDDSVKVYTENELLKEENTKLKDDNKKNQKINIELAKSIKKVYTDSVISAKIRLGDISVDNKDEETNKMLLLSSSELSELYNEIGIKETTNVSIPKITQEDIGALKVNQDKVDIGETTSSNNLKKKNTRFTAANAVDSLLDN
jgi:hypothetical protein